MIDSESNASRVNWDKLMAGMERPELYYKRPGRFRRWEIADVVAEDGDFRVMEDGTTSDGTRLYAIYRRESTDHVQMQAVLALVRHGRRATPRAEPSDRGRDSSPPLSSAAEQRAPCDGITIDGTQQTLPLGELAEAPRVLRWPGLFTRRELDQLLDPDADYRIEPGGAMQDGSELFAVFHRVHARPRGGA